MLRKYGGEPGGDRVSIAAIQLGSECGVGTVPGGQFTMSTTGALTIAPASVTDIACEGTYAVTGSGGFFDRELRITLNYASTASRCILRSFTTTMTRCRAVQAGRQLIGTVGAGSLTGGPAPARA